MAGLGATSAGRPEAMMPGAGGRGAGGSGPGGEATPMGLEPASEEEQGIYDTFVSMAMIALYDERMMPQLVRLLKSANDPVQAVAEIAASVAMRVYTKAQEDGAEIPGDVLLHAGREIVGLVIELAERAGIQPLTPEQAEEAFYAAADIFAGNAEEMGVYTEEIAKQDVQAINEMKASGRFDQVMQALAAARAQEAA